MNAVHSGSPHELVGKLVSKTWLIIGTMPPPIGGVTTFVERFSAKLRRRGATAQVLEPRAASSWLTMLRSTRRPAFVVINTLNPMVVLLARAICPFAFLIIVDHNHSRKVVGDGGGAARSRIPLMLYRMLFGIADRIWIVSDHLRVSHEVIGHSTKIFKLSPYLPPDRDALPRLVADYSYDLKLLSESRARDVVFVTSAYKLVSEGGRDLYGIDLAIRSLSKLVRAQRSARLVVFVADPGNGDLLAHHRDLANRVGLREYITWEVGQKALWPTLVWADCYLRLTSTDGWSISVEEALDLGCPVIASDVVPRDKRCILFPYPDVEALATRMLSVQKRR